MPRGQTGVGFKAFVSLNMAEFIKLVHGSSYEGHAKSHSSHLDRCASLPPSTPTLCSYSLLIVVGESTVSHAVDRTALLQSGFRVHARTNLR